MDEACCCVKHGMWVLDVDERDETQIRRTLGVVECDCAEGECNSKGQHEFPLKTVEGSSIMGL